VKAWADDTIGALAERVGLDQSTLSRNLRGLEQDGLVEIAIVENELRRRAVWLTEKARGGWRRRCRSGERLTQRSRAPSIPPMSGPSRRPLRRSPIDNTQLQKLADTAWLDVP
jgi:MarR family